MKVQRRFTTIIFLVVLVAIVLTGCGSDPAKSEDEVFNDLEQAGYFPTSGLEPTSLEVILRKTEKDDGVDYIRLEIAAENQFVDCVLTYDVYYTYYDKGGWVMDYANPVYGENWSISTVEELQLSGDIMDADTYISQHNLIIDGINLESRSISPELTAEEIFLTVSCHNDIVKCEIPMQATYALRENGWVLESHNLVLYNADIVPIVNVSANQVLDDAQANLEVDSLDFIHGDIFESLDTLHTYESSNIVTAKTTHPFMQETETYTVSYEFSREDLAWHFTGVEGNGWDFQWDATGIWSGSGETHYYDIFTRVDTTYSITAAVSQKDDTTLSIEYEIQGLPDGPHTGTTYFDLTKAHVHGGRGIAAHGEKASWLEAPKISYIGHFVFHEEKGLYFDSYDEYILTKQ